MQHRQQSGMFSGCQKKHFLVYLPKSFNGLFLVLHSWLLVFSFPFFGSTQPLLPDTSNRPPMPMFKAGESISGTDYLLEERRKSAKYRLLEEKMNEDVLKAINLLADDTVYLQVVVHIINENPATVTDATIQSAIKYLNDAFSKSGVFAASKGADTRIRFCLATIHPDGGITNGITRTQSALGSLSNTLIEEEELKQLIQWDSKRYINVWLLQSLAHVSSEGYNCGKWFRNYMDMYTSFPPAIDTLDGIVTTGFGIPFIREMGRFLGLYNTYQGGCLNNDCTKDGDRVCDTPPDNTTFYTGNCNFVQNSCTTDTFSNYSNGFFPQDVPDVSNNFMDEGFVTCKNNFTKGQGERMRAIIQTIKKGLANSACPTLCNAPITASFTRDNWVPAIGATIQFTNTSVGATRQYWYVDDVLKDSTLHFSYTFSQAGKFKVTLKVYASGTCFATQTGFVLVNCGVVSRFYSFKRTIASKSSYFLDSITFVNTSLGATNYEWLMSSNTGMAQQVVSTATNLGYFFPSPGIYSIRLVAINGGCRDTTKVYTVTIIEPEPDAIVTLQSVNCFNETRIQLLATVCNFGIRPIGKGMPVTFYDANPTLPGAKKITTFIVPDSIQGNCCSPAYLIVLNPGYRGLNQVFAVVNDDGSKSPLQLPNTNIVEKNYTNNITSVTNFQFDVKILPAAPIQEPGDTIQLEAITTPTNSISFAWSPAQLLSCTSCSSPDLITDSTRIKQVITISSYGCTDTAFVTIKVPVADDFIVKIDSAQCAGADSIRINFTLSNLFRRGDLLKGVQVRFYDGHPNNASSKWLAPAFVLPNTIKAQSGSFLHHIKAKPSGALFAVVNDNGTSIPVVLPNSLQPEKEYKNNIDSINYVRLKVTTNTSLVTAQPGDTLYFNAQAAPGNSITYAWSSVKLLDCIVCNNPSLIVDSNTVKMVTATNVFGCTDTASIVIKVPPTDDFTVELLEAECAANDSMFVRFAVNNLFRRGSLLKGVEIRFYNQDPKLANAQPLLPAFVLPSTINARSTIYTTFIKGSFSGKLFAVVNDNGTSLPLVLPNTQQPEKDYSNNIVGINYAPEKVRAQPVDTTVIRKSTFTPFIYNTIYQPTSTKYIPGVPYSLSCNQCPDPLITVFGNGSIPVEIANKYGCLLKGEIGVKIFPPDFTVEVLQTACISNGRTEVTFRLCMNNGYDTVWAGIPISFYDQPSSIGSPLQPVFVTLVEQAGGCFTYKKIINTPIKNALYAVVNDLGNSATQGPDQRFQETDATNNQNQYLAYKSFDIDILPADTTIERLSTLALRPLATGGLVTRYTWQPAQFLSCTDCAIPVVRPEYTQQYLLTVRNEYGCTDTAYTTIHTIAKGDLRMVTGFTPNGDALNDVFYVIAGENVAQVKDFVVFNRWGKKDFETHKVPPNNPIFGWNGIRSNGEKAGSGQYVYFITILMRDGTEKTEKGVVTLIR